jgi:hypothetical protein
MLRVTKVQFELGISQRHSMTGSMTLTASQGRPCRMCKGFIVSKSRICISPESPLTNDIAEKMLQDARMSASTGRTAAY